MDVFPLSQHLAETHCTQQTYKDWAVETLVSKNRINVFGDLRFIQIKLIPWIELKKGEERECGEGMETLG